MLINTESVTLLEPLKAEELALALNNDIEDDFVYTVIHDPKGTGKSFIRCHDADGYYVGKL
jgi:hypothetical protein